MRGIQFNLSSILTKPRIIPAHAGNTDDETLKIGVGQDHPRSCGEYLMSIPLLHPQKGSSPLMRGILFVNRNISIGTRIIPTHAGNTSASGEI